MNEKVKYDNQMAYMHGLYNFNAFSSVLSSAFGKQKVSYIEKPIPLTNDEVQDEEERQFELNKARFEAMRVTHNARFDRSAE